MLHNDQGVMFNIFIISLGSSLCISVIKLYANIALSIGRHCVLGYNEGK